MAGEPAWLLQNMLQIGNVVFWTTTGNVSMLNSGSIFIKKATPATTQVTLPSAATRGMFAFVKDAAGNAASYPITVVPDGTTNNTTIDGASSNVINTNYGSAIYEHNGNEWSLILSNLVGVGGAATFGNVTLTGLLNESVTDGLTALTGGQAGALAITTELSRVTTCAAGYGVALPPASAGLTIIIINHAANALTVYGNNTNADTIDDVATGTGVTQMQGSATIYTCTVSGPAGKWYSEGIGTGYSGSFPTTSYTDAITASTTHSQGQKLLLTAMNRITTAASGDVVTLPVSAGGMQVQVINATANSISIYPNAGGTGTETINALSPNASYSLATTKVVTFFCTVAGQWHTLLSA